MGFQKLGLAAMALAAATSAAAQFVQPLPSPDNAAGRLSGHLRTLAAAPRNVDALLGAGQAALEVGDVQAALGFFARAEELAPSNGRVKAGLGSALVQLEKPDDALRLFEQARALGVSEVDVARDRGLAHDLRGDTRRAQADYRLALTRGPNAETTRRLALSLGISGDRAGALAVLDPLLRQQDQGAWRARAFILAMTGDVAGANGVARQLLAPPLAASMAPLLSRLATLNPAERAHAVNFGTVPTDGTRLASIESAPTGPLAAPPSRPLQGASADSGLIPRGAPLGRREEVRIAAAPTSPPRTLPSVQERGPRLRAGGWDWSAASAGSRAARAAPGPATARATVPPLSPAAVPPPVQVAAAPSPSPDPAPLVSGAPTSPGPLGRRVGARIGPVDPSRLPPELRGEVRIAAVTQGTLPPPGNVAAPIVETPLPPSSAASPLPSPGFTTTPLETLPRPGEAPSVNIGPPADPPPFEVPATAAAASPPAAQPAPALAVSQPASSAADRAPAGGRLGDLLAGLAPEPETTPVELPSARQLREAREAARRRTAQAEAREAEERAARAAAAEKATAAKANPPRLWVQVATGANERGLPFTWRRIREGNEETLKGYAAYSVPFRATNRLLVGPVRSAAAARDLIRALAKNDVPASLFESEAGQEVARLATR